MSSSNLYQIKISYITCKIFMQQNYIRLISRNEPSMAPSIFNSKRDCIQYSLVSFLSMLHQLSIRVLQVIHSYIKTIFSGKEILHSCHISIFSTSVSPNSHFTSISGFYSSAKITSNNSWVTASSETF